VDTRPAPDLSDGTPVLIAYCANLNVAGTDQARVDATKERIAAHLRSLGFRIHEETAASNLAESLGYLIDGKKGLVSGKHEKCQKVSGAFQVVVYSSACYRTSSRKPSRTCHSLVAFTP
jgi:hypothetical protein